MPTSRRPRPPLLLVRATLVAMTAGLLTVAPPAPVSADDEGPVASGQDWSVDEVAGGYLVTLDLDRPLPVVDDLPMLAVDGTNVGLAKESEDGRSLSLVTALPSVAQAEDVGLVWASGTHEKAVPTSQPAATSAPPVRPSAGRATIDGAVTGPHGYRMDDYDFGDRVIPLEGIGGILGELRGRIVLPDPVTAPGPRPTIVLIHGRHTACWNLVAPGPNTPRWPCSAGQVEIPSYRGYDAVAQTLATWGYAVVSVSANAVNANDAQLAADAGALARGRLVMDTLAMLNTAATGRPVEYYSVDADRDVTLDEALDADTTAVGGPADGNELDADDLVGRFDLSRVGLVGHSRGGEGVAAAAALNLAEGRPFGISSTVLLAPVDFARRTTADVDTLVVLPYCDGDVADQQGQHYVDDARYAYGDDVLRTTAWAMGANHNFFNSVWTPGGFPYATSDDWWYRDDPACGPDRPDSARLTSSEQRDWSAAYLGAWFRTTLGQPDPTLSSLFDGSGAPVMPGAPSADVRVVAQAPASLRRDVVSFTTYDEDVRTGGQGTLTYCSGADVGGFTLPQLLAPCASATGGRLVAAMPHWTPADFAVDVPSSPMGQFHWSETDGTWAGSVRKTLPVDERDVSSFDALVFKTAPSESVIRGTDLRVTVVDGTGQAWSSRVSDLNPLALTRMPASPGVPWLDKIVLQQVWIPVSSITGINTGDVREIRLHGAVGADGTTSGGAYLSDLAWVRSGVVVRSKTPARPTISVIDSLVEEGAAPGYRKVAVVLDHATPEPVTGHASVTTWLGDEAKVVVSLRRVVFEPGETCVPVSLPTKGDLEPGATPDHASSSYPVVATSDLGAVPADAMFGDVVVREDDGLLEGSPLPPVGVQGDPCAELAAREQVFALDASDRTPTVGDTVALSGTGFRVRESVSFTDSSTGSTVGQVAADANGVARIELALDDQTAVGPRTVSAVGAGSGRRAAVELGVRAPTSTTLTMDPTVPTMDGALTLEAWVTGPSDGGVVQFRDGSDLVDTVPVSDGTAALSLPHGFGAGDHQLTATFAATSSALASTSNVIAFSLARDGGTIVLSLSGPGRYGRGGSGTVVAQDAAGGSARITSPGFSSQVPLDARGVGSFVLPAAWEPGSYRVVASYDDADGSVAQVAAATYRVVKAVPRIRAAVGRPGADGRIKVRLAVAGVRGFRAPTGQVVVVSGSHRRLVRLPRNGRKVVTSIPGTVGRLYVVYRGDPRYARVRHSFRRD